MELRQITVNDREQMLELLTNEKIKQTYMLPDFEKREDALPLFRRFCDLSQENGRFVRGIFSGRELVGFLNDVEIKDGAIELGYVIHPDHWGKGYATAALTLAMEALFEKSYRQVVTGAFSENKASLRVMEKAGMQKLDKTDEIEYRGKVHTCIYYLKECDR